MRTMTSRERIQTALNHREPDRVPFDIGAMNVASISSVLLHDLLAYYDLELQMESSDIIQRVGTPPLPLKELIGIDTVRIGPDRVTIPQGFPLWENPEKVYTVVDSWNVRWEMRPGDSYFNQVTYPLAEGDLYNVLDTYTLQQPNPNLASFVGRRLEEEENGDRYCLIDRDCAGMFEMSQRLRGMEQLMMDLIIDRKGAEKLSDLLLEYKFAYWNTMLEQVGDRQVVVSEADDFGTATSLLISPEMVRELYLSRFTELFTFIKKKAPNAKICFHSCGAVGQLIPNFIEAGVDILNPVQYSAEGMDLARLKRDFGKDMVFWGACIDTTDILPHRTVKEVEDEVKRVLDILAPGGGFVAAAVHNIQADVPIENVVALVETIHTYGVY